MPATIVTYDVLDSSTISIDVGAGNGQPEGSTVMLGTTQIASGSGLIAVPVGNGLQVRKQKLVVVTVVRNLNPAAGNRTNQFVDVFGGPFPKHVDQSQMVSAIGEEVTFVTVVTFI